MRYCNGYRKPSQVNADSLNIHCRPSIEVQLVADISGTKRKEYLKDKIKLNQAVITGKTVTSTEA